jgi:acyl-CoA reductase-like NAD-dependent aldehyde dehydrogenase
VNAEQTVYVCEVYAGILTNTLFIYMFVRVANNGCECLALCRVIAQASKYKKRAAAAEEAVKLAEEQAKAKADKELKKLHQVGV